MLSILLKLGFSLLLFNAIVIHGDDEVGCEQLEDRLNKMFNLRQKIDGLFRPFKDGLINKGKYGVVFKGIRDSDNLKVAMKFVKKKFKEEAKREYEIYAYLGAINNSAVEKFGIANVYHYNEDWYGYFLTVFSYLDGGNLLDRGEQKLFEYSIGYLNINTLIVLRDFVRQSKYMHSRGVRHDDIKPGNIVFRGHRTFLIDFNSSSKMNEFNDGGTARYLSRRAHKHLQRTPFCDWESFLYSLCYISNVELGWFYDSKYENMEADEASKEYGRMKNKINITDITKTIKDKFNGSLQKVLIEFSKEIFEPKEPMCQEDPQKYHNYKYYPNYDRFDELITDGIYSFYEGKYVSNGKSEQKAGKMALERSKRASFYWLSSSEKRKATTTFDITKEIDHPIKFYFTYPPVNYELFRTDNQEENEKKSFGGMSQIFNKNS